MTWERKASLRCIVVLAAVASAAMMRSSEAVASPGSQPRLELHEGLPEADVELDHRPRVLRHLLEKSRGKRERERERDRASTRSAVQAGVR